LPQLHLIAAGSLLGVKLSSVSFPVGKVNLLTMSPMSFGEFLQANDSKLYQYFAKIDIENPSIDDFYHEKLWQEFKYYLIVGGMPKVVNEFVAHRSDLSKALALVEEVQAELLNTYYADIAKHSGKANAMHVQRILLNIPAQLAKAADGNSSRYHFKNVIEGKKQYSELIDSIDWLEAAGLIHKIKILDNINQPLMAHTKENFFKLYLFDLGILRALSKLDPSTILDYNFGTYKGYIAENFVLQQFVHASLAKESFYSWKENEAEIEFVRDIKGKIVPYEVKSGHRTQSKSLASFVKKYSPEKFYILSAQKPFIDKSGLHKMPIYLAGLL
jgi:predicted AAA+ superfamily ATPase